MTRSLRSGQISVGALPAGRILRVAQDRSLVALEHENTTSAGLSCTQCAPVNGTTDMKYEIAREWFAMVRRKQSL